MFVHHIDHPVAKSPQGKQEDEEDKDEQDVSAVLQNEHAFFRGEARIERSRSMFGSRNVHNFTSILLLERDPHLRANHDGVRDVACAARIDDNLNIRLKVTPACELKTVRELDDLFRLGQSAARPPRAAREIAANIAVNKIQDRSIGFAMRKKSF